MRIRFILFAQKAIYALARFWYPLLLSIPILVFILGFLAPALMAEGEMEQATAVYRFLAIDNHQMPDRTYFLFGAEGGMQTYGRETLIAAGADPQAWEDFVGNDDLGYKTGLNHRMIAILAGIIVGGLAWGFSRGRLRVSIILFALLVLPLVVDGVSHVLSEEGSGVRASNEWAAVLTGGAFPDDFYQGDQTGSLNWWLRTLTGFLFGVGSILFLFGRLDDYFRGVRQKLEPRLKT
jgi:uncharacterized membrane protein